MSRESSSEERFLELYLYNTNRKIRWESITSTGADSGPDSLLEAFVDMLKECDRLKYHVTTAVYTHQSGLVYITSENDEWAEAAPGPASSSSTNTTSDEGNFFYPEGRSLNLHVYNIGGGTTYKSTVPGDNPAAHAHLLRHFLSALEYCRANTQYTVRNAAYTDEDASINISGVDAEWVKDLDVALKNVARPRN